MGVSTINSPAPQAYPIASQTFIDMYTDPCKSGGLNSSTASGLKKFLTYAFGAGQQTLGAGSSQIPYAPLPANLRAEGHRAAREDDLQWVTDLVGNRRWRPAPPQRARPAARLLERSAGGRLPDRVLRWGLTGLAALILALLAYFFIRLIGKSDTALSKFGLSFVFGNDWDVSRNIYHGAALLVGTLVTSAIALIIGVPIAVATAVSSRSCVLGGCAARCRSWSTCSQPCRPSSTACGACSC